MNVNEFAPEIRSISPCSPYVHTSTLSSQNSEYLIEVNLDSLAADQSSGSLELVRIDAIDQDDSNSNLNSNQYRLSAQIEARVAKLTSFQSQEDDNIDMMISDTVDPKLLFSIDLDKKLIVYLDEMRKFAADTTFSSPQIAKLSTESLESASPRNMEEISIHFVPVIAFITVVVEDRGEMSTRGNLVVVLFNNHTQVNEFKRLDALMSKRYGDIWPTLRL